MPIPVRDKASLAPPWRWVWAFALPDRRERLRMTFAGYTLCTVSALLGVAAYNNASNILFLSLSLTLSMFGLNTVLSRLNFWKLAWRLVPPSRGRVGEPAVARVVVRNGRSALPAYALSFPWTAEGVETPSPVRLGEPLEAGGVREVPVEFTPVRRGRMWVVLEGATSSHPFALMFKSELKPVGVEFPVLPSRVPYVFEGEAGRRLPRSGDRLRRGPGTELLGLRDYRAGDPPRIIHWKSTAKRRRLVVRETSEPGESGFAIRLDPAEFASAPAAWEKAVSCAASLAEDLFARGRLSAAGVAPDASLKMVRPRDLEAFLEALAAAPVVPSGVPKASDTLFSETLRFVPGPGDVVHVLLANRIVGEA